MIAEAIAYLALEHRKMIDALAAIGHPDAFEVEPMNLEQQITAVSEGDSLCIGSAHDPYVLMSEMHEPIGAYYVEIDDERCWIRWVSGRQDFMAALEQVGSVH